MLPITATLRGSFSSCLIHQHHKPTFISDQYCSRDIVRRPNSSPFSSVALSHASFELFPEDNQQNRVKNLSEKHPVRPDYQTYLWLLLGCLNSSSGSSIEVSKLHTQILKLGFVGEFELSSRLLEFYKKDGNFRDVFNLFDEMLQRSCAMVPVSLWNRIISGCSANNVLGLFLRMLNDNVSPDECTFANVLRASSVERGKRVIGTRCVEQIHAKIIRFGFGSNPLACNPLIDFYSKNGLIGGAKRVFEELSLKDNVSWVAMISGLSQNGKEEESILLFRDEMHTRGVIPTPYVLSSVLSASSKMEFFELGEELHGLVIKWGLATEVFVCNALVTMYSRSGDITSAERTFGKMQNKDGVSFNSLISGLAQQGLSDKALKLLQEMQRNYLKLDYITVASLLSSCAAVGVLDKGRQLHTYALKAGFCSDMIVEGSLLDLYVKCSDIETACKYFLTTETENVALWNAMLVAYGQMGNLSESYRIFLQMQIKGLEPNEYTYPSMLKTCIFVGALDLGEQIHGQIIKTAYQYNIYVRSMLIDMYAKGGDLGTARKIFMGRTEDDLVSWTALIAGYAQHDMHFEALKLFEEMQDYGIHSDNIGFSSAISACAGIQALNQGRQIHAQSCVFGYSNDVSIANALVSLYARCGEIKEAYLAFEKINAKDNISWNALISGFSQSGYSEQALLVFSRMNQAGLESNQITYISAISAAANTANVKQGRQIHAKLFKARNNFETEASNALITLYAKCGDIDDARREFSEMSEKNEVSWNAMITGYSQHGYGEKALEIFEEMKKLGLMPNHVTFVGVLSACSHVGLVEEGLRYFESMSKEHGLVPKAEHYVCVVDMLGRTGSLSRARKFIENMPIEPDAMVWRTLLSACTVHKNLEIGEFAAGHLLRLEPDDSATFVLISNLYAVNKNWVFRDKTREIMKKRGVKKEPGRSWVQEKDMTHAFYAGDLLHPLSDEIYQFLEDLNNRVAETGYVPDPFGLLNDSETDQIVNVHSERLAIAFGLLRISEKVPLKVFKNLRVCGDCHKWIKCVSKVSNRAIIVRDAYRFHHFEGGLCSCRDFW